MRIVRTLMTHIIDYAGLFPPAKLDMAATVHKYAQYLSGDNAWMLGRLIVPARGLAEFDDAAATLLPSVDDSEPWRISALTAPADDSEALQRDLDAIESFNRSHAGSANGRTVIDAIELKAATSESIEDALDLIPNAITPFFELSLATDLRGMLVAIAGNDACAKVRTGGVTPDLFPSPADLAGFIALSAAADVPFKATAGLHHLVRHASAGVSGAKEYGFLNVFLGAALIKRQRISQDQLEEILADEDTTAFSFSEDHASWRGHDVTLDEIARARSTFALSYGSCSFEEPLDDLRELKLLS